MDFAATDRRDAELLKRFLKQTASLQKPPLQPAARPKRKMLSQVSCSLTAEAGRISRGTSAPQRSAPAAFFFQLNIFSAG
jgi:hypothetical protein